MPVTPPGLYTALVHQDRGLVMSDLPAEIADALPFLDYAAGQSCRLRVLIAGLGLGIVPAWLLVHASIARIDIIEIDADVIGLITRGCCEKGAPNKWATDPRLHIHHGDAHTWWPSPADRRGCAVHGDCVLQAGTTWQAGFFDIWDGISPSNLPSIHRLTRRVGKMCRGSAPNVRRCAPAARPSRCRTVSSPRTGTQSSRTNKAEGKRAARRIR